MAMTIEEASKQLDAAVRAVRRLRESGAEPAYVLAVYRAKKRALALAVLEEAVVGARYTPKSKAAWIVNLRARIAALGGKDAS